MTYGQPPHFNPTESPRTRRKSGKWTGKSVGNTEYIVQVYGDLLFDLCNSVLKNTGRAQSVFRAILKDVRKAKGLYLYQEHERPWIFRVACDRLLATTHQFRELSQRRGPEWTQLESPCLPEDRLEKIPAYLARLPAQDYILILLRDKYGLPFPEISAALGLPEGSLKLRRQHALRSLEDWIWEP